MAIVTINQFLESYKKETSDFNKKMKRVIFNICSDVQLQAIRNVDRLLNKSKGLKRKRAGSRGSLRNSIKLKGDTRENTPFVEAGEGLSYAAIHEFGGIIRPVQKKWLTIPVSQEAFGHTAEEVSKMIVGKKGKKGQYKSGGLIFKMINPSLAMLYEQVSLLRIKVHFWLKKEVHMPARSYLGSAGIEIMKNQKQYVNQIMGTSDTPWKVS